MAEDPIDLDLKGLQQAANEASNQVRTLYVTYLVLLAYLVIIIGSTQDRDILIDQENFSGARWCCQSS